MSSLCFAACYSEVADAISHFDDRLQELLSLQMSMKDRSAPAAWCARTVDDFVDELCQLAHQFGIEVLGERPATLFFKLAEWTAQGDLEYDFGISLMNSIIDVLYPNAGYASRALFVSVAIYDAEHAEPFPMVRHVGDDAKLSSWFDFEKDMCQSACWFWQELTIDILPPIADRMEYFVYDGVHYDYEPGYDFSSDDYSDEEFDEDFIANRSHDWDVVPRSPPEAAPAASTPFTRAIVEIKEALFYAESLPADSDDRVRATGRSLELAVQHLRLFLDENSASCQRFIATMFTKMSQLHSEHAHRFDALGIDGPNKHMARAILLMFDQLHAPGTRVVLRSQLLARLRCSDYDLSIRGQQVIEEQLATYNEVIQNIPNLISQTSYIRAISEDVGINDPPLDAGVIDAWNCYELRSGLVVRALPEQPELNAIEHHGLTHPMDEDPSPRWNNDGGDTECECRELQNLDDSGLTVGYAQHLRDCGYSSAVNDGWFDAEYNHNDYTEAGWGDY
jgi:hypothetical protein